MIASVMATEKISAIAANRASTGAESIDFAKNPERSCRDTVSVAIFTDSDIGLGTVTFSARSYRGRLTLYQAAT
jgi:hypothetical protein